MTPLERYQQDCQSPAFVVDDAQKQAVEELNDVYQRLLQPPKKKGGWFSRNKVQTVIGLYMWGGVGRGKTYLMDTFFEALPFKEKKRMHFHHFMRMVHHKLQQRQGEKNPLDAIASEFASQARVLCLDEFFVTDITDAMLLGGLLGELFRLGVTLVTTSNIVPDKLYENGLQRDRFLPAIDQLKQFTKVLNVDGGEDFRLRHNNLTDRYLCPLGDDTEELMEQWLQQLTRDEGILQRDVELPVEGRVLQAKAVGNRLAWFDFRTLCEGPRSQNDYIALAKRFDTVLLSHVERMGADDDSEARRFINLIDEFYDRGVKMIISSEAPILEIYRDGRLEFEFERTASRLQEMQTEEYLERERRVGD